MESWYVWDDDVEHDIGPMAFDELVARTWDGSITPDTAIHQGRSTARWQVARDVEVVGPLLEAVAAARPPGRHWQRVARRRADGTLWAAMFKSWWGPWLVGLAIFFGLRLWTGHEFVEASTASGWLGWGSVLQPRYSISWWLSHLGDSSLALLLALVAQISWYFISDIARDRRARSAARTSASGAKHDDEDAAIFVYDLSSEVRGKLTEFDSAIASPTDDSAIAPPVAHED